MPSAPDSSGGGLVAEVAPGSPAERAGLAVGDRVLSVAGEELRDVIDWMWAAGEPTVSVQVIRADGTRASVLLERAADEAWGFDFSEALFDGVRTCANRCEFCFVAQLPPGLRRSLYVRDDDFRLSFLSGNFITLTNLADADVQRILDQALSPLYVSLHVVDPALRARLLCPAEDRALERFDQLLEGGVDLHVQIVLVPGANDGDALDETLTWLAEREGVTSVGVVPLGYTKYQDRYTHSYANALDAAKVIQQVQRWQFAMRERDGVTWVHLADEFYLNAGAPLPSTDFYDGFPQYENGIGLVRSFVDEVTQARVAIENALLGLPPEEESVTVVTGIMAVTTLAGAMNACEAAGRVRLLGVPNSFFAGNVSVTGLLTGRDIAEAIASDAHPGIYVLPDVIFNAEGKTLDELDLDALREFTGADIRVVSSDAAGLVDAFTGAQPTHR
ncbi:MAG: DUF512 domain-containing protein [Coriobacteriia bacterium]|nr:DUF512 domain-containing protein [Coriobacteriia bacterium]